MLNKIIISALGIGAGFVMLMYTRQVMDFTGANDFVEKWFGRGQSYTFIKVVGIFFIFLSFLYLIGDLDWMFNQ